MPSKIMIFDEKSVLVSSFNWNQDVDSNHNAGAHVIDSVVTRQFIDYFANLE